jgi:Ala-tRNA(Pro) deacylase
VDVLARIRELLDEAAVEFREVEHEPTYTSEESARARGEDIRIGGKALLLKVGDAFALFVMSAARRVDSGKIRKRLGARRSRFASHEELHDKTGLVPGSVPPFGEPVLPFVLYADISVLQNEKIAFNAGSLTHSVIMRTEDWRRIAQPVVFEFSKPPGDRN